MGYLLGKASHVETCLKSVKLNGKMSAFGYFSSVVSNVWAGFNHGFKSVHGITAGL
jgi:hypothetical protein